MLAAIATSVPDTAKRRPRGRGTSGALAVIAAGAAAGLISGGDAARIRAMIRS
jgi:hypothetical protein